MSVDRETIVDIIRKARSFHQMDQLTPTSNFDDLGLDSLDRMNVYFAIEEHFKFRFENESIAQLVDVSSLQSYVNKKLESPVSG